MELKIGIIGLGYVGLPLAVEFGKKYSVIGFDINPQRVNELRTGYDRTLEVSVQELKSAKGLSFTNSEGNLAPCNVFIICAPTPVNPSKRPDLNRLLKATQLVAKLLKKNDLVIYESTVYPGCTEEECVPILEDISQLKYNQDFFCGYSPERINPGDKEHTLTKIKKVTSGSTPDAAMKVDALYASIIEAGTHLAPSIKVAEAAKVIENSQRDINIAFVNELALIFNRMNINTLDVLKAASTKWNFLPFKPGLVGGHCIGVDPYYLTYKAESLGYHPEVILAGRRINDNMGLYVAGQIIKLMIKKGHRVEGSRVLVLGITFKENCPDIRNTGVIAIIRELRDFGCKVDICDPWADSQAAQEEYGIQIHSLEKLEQVSYEAIVLAVAHHQFIHLDIQKLKHPNGVIYDIKGVLPNSQVDGVL